MRVRSLGHKGPLEKEMATHSCSCLENPMDRGAWYSHLLKNFPQFLLIHTVKGFGIVNKAEVETIITKLTNLITWTTALFNSMKL